MKKRRRLKKSLNGSRNEKLRRVIIKLDLKNGITRIYGSALIDLVFEDF